MPIAQQHQPPLSAPVTVSRIPDPAEPVPAVAWPTLMLLLAGLAMWLGSSAAYLAGATPWWLTIPLNAIASYLLFTVAHDAGHHAASSSKRLNDLEGRLAVPFVVMHAAFPVWRYIHMQHHRFTNHDDGQDPDHYTMRGARWQAPVRWLTIDYNYVAFYLPRMRSRPRPERIEGLAFLALALLLPVVLAATGHIVDWLVIFFVPSRLTILFLGWAFDYLPHHGLHHRPGEDRLKTTRNRIGGERWLSPTLLYQNYHLVHHLHPVVPFYRYLAVWRRGEERYLDGEPALSTVRGRAITAEEYRRMRALVEAHD